MTTVRQVVTFKGVPDKLVDHVVEMLRLDVAKYPDRCSMESAEVGEVGEVHAKAAKPKPAKARTKTAELRAPADKSFRGMFGGKKGAKENAK